MIKLRHYNLEIFAIIHFKSSLPSKKTEDHYIKTNLSNVLYWCGRNVSSYSDNNIN